MALTGLMTVASSGLIANQGLDINPDMVEQINVFNTQNISGAVQNYLASLEEAEQSTAIEELNLAPNFITGLLPDGIELDNPTTNVVQSLLDQANTVFPNVGNFITVYTRAVNYAIEIFNFKGTVAAAQNTTFEDLGFQYKNYSDVASGGISSQFKMEKLPNLAKEFSNLGTLFPTKDLGTFGNVQTVSQAILDQGLGYVGNFEQKIKAANIDLNNLVDSDYESLTNIMKSISGSSMTEIFTVTEFKPAKLDNIKNLSDVLNIKNVFSDSALEALDANDKFEDLGRKLSNVGGNFKDAASLGNFYSSIEHKSSDSLNSMTSLLPPEMASSLSEVGAKGTGIFGNPTVVDIIGSVSGIGYTEDLTAINQLQVQLLTADSDLVEFKTYLESGNIDLAGLNSRITTINSKSELISKFKEGNDKFRNIADRLKLEQNNITESKVLVDVTAATSTEIINFSSKLHDYSNDKMKLSTADLLNNIVTSDVYGDSIRSCLAEGKNLTQLESVGIDAGTKLDAMSYAKKLTG